MSPDPEFIRQYEALTRGVGFAPLSRTIIEVTGTDRVQILQSFTTNDVKRLRAGQGCEAFVTNSQGKTLGHIWIFCEHDCHIIDTTPEQAKPLIDHFNRYVITEDVTFTDRSSEFVDLLVAGPAAENLLSKLTGATMPREFLDHGIFKVAGQDVTIRRVEFAGHTSYFVQARQTEATEILNALAEAGAILCSPASIESARLEAGFPLFGIDITPENLPQEVARDTKAISFTKGCYLGQETVARIDAIGHVNRLLVGVKFEGGSVPAAGTELLAAGQKVGEVMSAAWSPRLQAPLALAYVRRSHAKPGSQLVASSGPVITVALPLAGLA